MNAKEVYAIFEEKQKDVEKLIDSVGNDPLRRNALINNTYLSLYKQDPTFIWLAAATLGSEKVGQNIHAASIEPVNYFV